jgi:hypothetical protein
MLKDDSIKTEGIITELVPLSDVVKGGFEELVDHNDRHVKILVDFSGLRYPRRTRATIAAPDALLISRETGGSKGGREWRRSLKR